MAKRLKTVIWLTVALAALLFLAYKTGREKQTFIDAVKNVDWTWALLGCVLYLIAQTLLASRWILLLKVHGVNISLYQAVKLTYLGLFYNNMMPGSVGGDLLKGWYITHHSRPDRRLEAVVTVFVDRLVGLIGMIIVGALASLFVGSQLKIPVLGRNVEVRFLIWTLLAGLVIVSVVFLSRRIRRLLLLSWLLEKLPFARQLRQIDQAIRIYRRHIAVMFGALVLTAVIQGLAIVAIWMMARQALNLPNVRFIQCLIIMPIVWLISAAIPVPGGLGVMENLFIPFFARAIDPAVVENTQHWLEVVALAAALALMNRLMICICSLPAALVPIFGGHLPKTKQMQDDLQQDTP